MEEAYKTIQRLEMLRLQMDNERTSFKSHWRDLNDYILPRRGRFFVSDTNRGDRRSNKIIDTTATLAVRTLRSGMMAGVTSPARPWFRLSTPTPGMEENDDVRSWLDSVSSLMTTVFLRSNLYNVLPIIYGDMGTFGTACMLMEEDEQNILRFYPFPIGSYSIANNEKLQVDTFFREFQLTARQVVEKFGRDPQDPTKINWDNLSVTVKSYWDRGLKEEWVDIVHAILPNPNYDPNKSESKFKKYLSVYYEQGKQSSGTNRAQLGFGSLATNYKGEKIKYLRERGYDYFPILAPRWEITGEDVYGTDCPGMTALGDIKQLQLGERRSMQAIEKMVNPPMIGPVSLKTSKVSLLPGDVTYTDEREGVRGFRPAHEIRFDVNALEQKQGQTRQRVSRAFFEDLFLMLANSDRRQITAREIEERHEEKLLALGPVLEQLNQDLLDPLIDNTFMILLSRGLIPPAPEALQGADLKVEYISIMAQAQKLSSIGAIERFTNFTSNLAGADPSVLDKIDFDNLVDTYGDITSVPSGIIRSKEDVEAMRAQRAQAQAAQQQQQMMAQGADMAKALGETKIDEGSALGELVDRSGVGELI